MLCQMSRCGRVDAMLKDALVPSADATGIPVGATAIRNLAQILRPKKVDADCAPTPLTLLEAASALKNAPELHEFDYTALLHYLQRSGRQYRTFPIPKKHSSFPHEPKLLFSCTAGNVLSAVNVPIREIARLGSITRQHKPMLQDLLK